MLDIPELKSLLQPAPGLEMSQTFKLQPKVLLGRSLVSHTRSQMLLECVNSPLSLQNSSQIETTTS